MANIQVICNLVASLKNFPTILSGSEINNEGGGSDQSEVCMEFGVDVIITKTLKDA